MRQSFVIQLILSAAIVKAAPKCSDIELVIGLTTLQIGKLAC
jgi:hypothetical protein